MVICDAIIVIVTNSRIDAELKSSISVAKFFV